MGAVYPNPTAEPVDQGRDSSRGLLIASGIFDGSYRAAPPGDDLGRRSPAFKLRCGSFSARGERFEFFRERFGECCIFRRSTEQIMLVSSLLFQF